MAVCSSGEYFCAYSHMLWHRDLSSNDITSIATGVFTGLGKLTSLYVTVMSVSHACSRMVPHRSLNGNKLTSITSGAFTGLGNLASLCGYLTELGCWLFNHNFYLA